MCIYTRKDTTSTLSLFSQSTSRLFLLYSPPLVCVCMHVCVSFYHVLDLRLFRLFELSSLPYPMYISAHSLLITTLFIPSAPLPLHTHDTQHKHTHPRLSSALSLSLSTSRVISSSISFLHFLSSIYMYMSPLFLFLLYFSFKTCIHKTKREKGLCIHTVSWCIVCMCTCIHIFSYFNLYALRE